MSANTLKYHHDKHHAKYVATTNELIKGTPLETASLDEIVKASYGA
jgi:Fe-Mn family superoxide dismutase